MYQSVQKKLVNRIIDDSYAIGHIVVIMGLPPLPTFGTATLGSSQPYTSRRSYRNSPRTELTLIHFPILKFLVPIALVVSSNVVTYGDDLSLKHGAQIYAKSCASCHGKQGEGVSDKYPDPLAGDLSIGQLTQTIAETMPEEDPDACVTKDAHAVAQYIHHAFYSEAARVRNRPPKIAFSRLTAEQLRQSLADLYARFAGGLWMHHSRGLRAIYFDHPGWKQEKKRIERTDPVIDFDFGHKGPGHGIDPKKFFITWDGGLLVKRTGQYEFVLRSTCSCKMHLVDDDKMFIDNHVQSEGRTEFRRRIHLTAGRVYTLRLEFLQRERKTEQPPAKFSLSWIPPGGVEQIIPTRHLLDSGFAEAFALQAKLPPDDSSYGYARGTSINRMWDNATSIAAIEFATAVSDRLWPEYQRRHKKEPNEKRKQLKTFLTELLETAFRGPIDDATRKMYLDEPVEMLADDSEAIRLVALMICKSPRFLYPTMDKHQSPSRRAANRLSLVLHDSLPTEKHLLNRAEKDQLTGEKKINEAAWSLVDDYRCRAKVRDFFRHWFHLDYESEISKDTKQFSEYNEAVVADLRDSFDATIDEIVWSEQSDFRQVFQADWVYTTDRLENFYGPSWKVKDVNKNTTRRLRRSVSDSKNRIGLVTHPLLMSQLSYYSSTSPIHRGVFLYRHLLGRTLRPPNAAFAPLADELHPDLTTRERVELQTGEVSCQVCHDKINGLGFALEEFDAVGFPRDRDNGKPVDASGRYVTRKGDEVKFAGARDLANFLATSRDGHRAFVEAMFEYMVKQPVAAYEPTLLNELTERFRNSGFKIRDLVVLIATKVAFHAATQTTAEHGNQET